MEQPPCTLAEARARASQYYKVQELLHGNMEWCPRTQKWWKGAWASLAPDGVVEEFAPEPYDDWFFRVAVYDSEAEFQKLAAQLAARSSKR